jgi:hypothetical protein
MRFKGRVNEESPSLVEAYGPELFLLLAVHESMLAKVALQAGCLFVEVVAKLFQAIELLVSQQHIDARDEDGWVMG